MKLLISFVLFATVQYTSAGDAANGKKLWKKINCTQCHGKKGMGKAKMKDGEYQLNPVKGPRVAGLSEEYIVAQLLAVQGKDKKTARKTKFTTSMKTKIKKYSKKDFEDLAAYISKEINPSAGTVKGMLE